MTRSPVGVLLAAGLGRRYDPRGVRLKLLEPTADGPNRGLPMAAAAARNLRAALPRVVAVVRPSNDEQLQRLLKKILLDEGCEVHICPNAADGMGASIACAVNATKDADGWLIALADMPMIAPSTIAAVAAATKHHVAAAPYVHGQRGHPVGFSRSLLGELLALDGDLGARSILQAHPPHRVEVDDAGTLFDIDRPPT